MPTSPTPDMNRGCLGGATAPDVIRAMVVKEAQMQGVDEKLAVVVADIESGFGQNVNSPAGARGPMQLMPATAEHYGVRDICDAGQNIRGGIAFLKDLMARFGGNIMLVAAAYNAGEDRVLKARGIPAIAETVSYTARAANIYYGFDSMLRGSRREALASVHAAAAPARSEPAQALPVGNDQILRANQTGQSAAFQEAAEGSVLIIK